MHQLLFPPRLEVVVQQQQSNCLAAHGGSQFALHRLLGDQLDGPACQPIRWIGAHHGDDPVALTGVQSPFAAGPRQVNESALQAPLAVSPADVAHRLGRDSNGSRHRWRRLPLTQQQQGACSLNQPHRLNATAEQGAQFVSFLGREFDGQLAICAHVPAYAETFLHTSVVYAKNLPSRGTSREVIQLERFAVSDSRDRTRAR